MNTCSVHNNQQLIFFSLIPFYSNFFNKLALNFSSSVFTIFQVISLLMNPSVSFPRSVLFLLLLTLFLSSSFASHANEDDRFKNCEPFDCGKIKEISYPFRRRNQPEYCGHPGFVVDCESDQNSLMFDADAVSQKFLVLDINQKDRVLKIARMDFWDSYCPENFINITLNPTLFQYTPKDKNTTLFYDCNNTLNFSNLVHFDCPGKNVSGWVYFVPEEPYLGSPNFGWPECSISVVVHIMEEVVKGQVKGLDEVLKVFQRGFEVEWKIKGEDKCRECLNSRGRCGYNSSATDQDNHFMCFCPLDHQSDGLSCGPSQKPAPESPVYPPKGPDPEKSQSERNLKLKIGIGVGCGLGGAIIMFVVLLLCYRMRHKREQNPPKSLLSRDISSDFSSVNDAEKGSTYFGVHLFGYEELVDATNNFDTSKELGDGGFGTVYYGKLYDGRVVAVKRLYENNFRRVEQFKNEIEILARLRHRNLVSLYGCTSRHSHELLLVYEYIPNGTVADHLHGQRAKPGALPWAIRLNIAIETACALTYLHASDIIHRDVKTNNILLDNNFSVKVADFGLSRLFPTHVTHVSTAPQGTPGYVDPEYHQCYQLTSKSDVFSFGVVMMELVSSMPAVDITRHRHDINLSTMAMNRIQNHALNEVVDPTLGFDTDSRVRKMITAVAELAFQCLQHEKDLRPSMVDVLEELKAIQSRDYSMERAEKIDAAADDAVLLMSGPHPLSPDSVVFKWESSTTTPNASS